jgi:hypothetical protein
MTPWTIWIERSDRMVNQEIMARVSLCRLEVDAMDRATTLPLGEFTAMIFENNVRENIG